MFSLVVGFLRWPMSSWKNFGDVFSDNKDRFLFFSPLDRFVLKICYWWDNIGFWYFFFFFLDTGVEVGPVVSGTPLGAETRNNPTLLRVGSGVTVSQSFWTCPSPLRVEVTHHYSRVNVTVTYDLFLRLTGIRWVVIVPRSVVEPRFTVRQYLLFTLWALRWVWRGYDISDFSERFCFLKSS